MAIGVLITLLHFPPSRKLASLAVTESDSNATCVAIFGRLDQTPTTESVNKCDKQPNLVFCDTMGFWRGYGPRESIKTINGVVFPSAHEVRARSWDSRDGKRMILLFIGAPFEPVICYSYK